MLHPGLYAARPVPSQLANWDRWRKYCVDPEGGGPAFASDGLVLVGPRGQAEILS